MADEFHFSKTVQSGCKTMALLTGILILTLPVAIWFWLKAKGGSLKFHDDGIEINGLGISRSHWKWDEIERLGTLEKKVPNAGIGGAIAAKMCGGRTAINMCAKTKSGKTRYFMVSRYEGHKEIVQRIQAESGKDIEIVKQGLNGPKFA